jgi:hypothetical protein
MGDRQLMVSDLLLIPYGTAVCQRDPRGAVEAGGAADAVQPAVAVDRRRSAPLRLSDGPYPFVEPPDLVRMTGVAERFEFLREHVKAQCGVWDKLPRLFLDAYFAFVLSSIAAQRPRLEASALASGGLFAPIDWCFSALRPLPQAHLIAPLDRASNGRGEPADLVKAEITFWTGEGLVAIEPVGSATPRRQRREELARLARGGVTVIEIPGGELQRQGDALLARLLPPSFGAFWEGVDFPSSPFGPQLLDDILPPEEASAGA